MDADESDLQDLLKTTQMKKPHARALLVAWRKLKAIPEGVPPEGVPPAAAEDFEPEPEPE